jgi:hypothetical protein
MLITGNEHEAFYDRGTEFSAYHAAGFPLREVAEIFEARLAVVAYFFWMNCLELQKETKSNG